jgi:hypothetical protein
MDSDGIPLQVDTPSLIIQDQLPDHSQQQIVESLEALQRLAEKVVGRVQERAVEEQGKHPRLSHRHTKTSAVCKC